jgi:hypothetical protein
MERRNLFFEIREMTTELASNLQNSWNFQVQGLIGLIEHRLNNRSEDLRWLLKESTIKKLFAEQRIPMLTGRLGHFDKQGHVEWKNYYQVPPKGYASEEVEEVFNSHGVTFFKFRDGSIRGCDTFSLTEEEDIWLNRQLNLCNDVDVVK